MPQRTPGALLTLFFDVLACSANAENASLCSALALPCCVQALSRRLAASPNFDRSAVASVAGALCVASDPDVLQQLLSLLAAAPISLNGPLCAAGLGAWPARLVPMPSASPAHGLLPVAGIASEAIIPASWLATALSGGATVCNSGDQRVLRPDSCVSRSLACVVPVPFCLQRPTVRQPCKALDETCKSSIFSVWARR